MKITIDNQERVYQKTPMKINQCHKKKKKKKDSLPHREMNKGRL